MIDWSKFKAFVDDNSSVAKMVKIVFDRVENIMRKGENGDYQHFSSFPTMFSNGYFLWVA